jgi:hypothetical protein
VDARQHDDPLAAAKDVLDVDREAVPVLADALEEAPDGVLATEIVAVGQVLWDAPVDLLLERGKDGWDVAASECVVNTLNYIHT